MDTELDLATSSMVESLASTSSSQPAVKGRETRIRLHFFPIWWNDAARRRGSALGSSLTITVCLTCTPGRQGGPHHEDADHPLLGVAEVDIVGHLGVCTVLYCNTVQYCTLYCTWESCSAVEAHTTTVPWVKAPSVAEKEECK